MSDTSESLTPSLENLANMNDVRTYEAIDNLMQKDEQTYDEFLNGFTYLNKDDVVKDAQRKQLKKVMNAVQNSKEEKTETNITAESQPKDVSQDDDSDIEEEVLEEGTKTSRMSNASEVVTNSGVKFDNFVDTEELSDNDEDVVGGYVSSFGNTEVPKSTAPGEADRTSDQENGVKMDEIDTDGLNSPSKDLLNPGEVEEVEDAPSVNELQIDRCLEFSAKLKSDSVVDTVQNTEETETLTDEVKPFSLDENFDYDNVILTPKFTTQEMTYINSFIPQKKELT